MPETADVGDAGSVFAPASGAHKRPRIEAIHDVAKKQHPARKRICMGGGRVSGRSRENLISGLISPLDLVRQQHVEVTPVAEEHGRATQRHLPANFPRHRTTALSHAIAASVDPAIVRRYSEMRAETEAQVRAFRLRHPPIFFAPDMPRVSAAAAQEPQPMKSEFATHAPGVEPAVTRDLIAPTHVAIDQEAVSPTIIPERDGLEVDVAPTTISQRDVAPTIIRLGDGLEVDVAPTTNPQRTCEEVDVAHAAVAQDVSSRPIHPSSSTQTGSLMLRSYAYEDTRSGYYDDYDLDYPLI